MPYSSLFDIFRGPSTFRCRAQRVKAHTLLSQSRRRQAEQQRISVHADVGLFKVRDEHGGGTDDLPRASFLEVISMTFPKEADSLKGEQN